jgi:hypothetical protein
MRSCYIIVPFGLVEAFKEDDISKFIRRLCNLSRNTRLTFHSLHLTYYFVLSFGTLVGLTVRTTEM